MTRVVSIVVLVVALLAAPLAAGAQLPPKVSQIGLLWFGSRVSESSSVEAFMAGLRELGYVEGQNVVLQSRFAEGNPERLATAAAELVRLGVDVLVTYGDVGVRAAKQATGTIPIVVALTGDLVAAGHAASLARPGGNVTGQVDTSPELSAKRVELLRASAPTISRVAVLWNPSNRVKVLDFQMTQVAAQTLGVPLQSVEVRQPDDIGPAVSAAVRERAGALLVLSDALTNAQRVRIVELANQNRLPTMYFSREWVAAGGLMAYGPNWRDMYRHAATYVDKILRGTKPGDLPIEQPTTFEFVINLKTAKALGLTIPPAVLARADEVIE
jgi:putative tryptophan/tyrosine transport system substrate-binding protein